MGRKAIHRIDLSDYSIQSLSFELFPESLYVSNGKLFVALCTQAHSSSWHEEDRAGAFAIVDVDSFSTEKGCAVNTDPGGLVVTTDGLVCTASGSGQV